MEHRASRSRDSEPKPCHLLDCLSSFTELEELTETELYHCHTCKKKQTSTKQFWVRRLPNVRHHPKDKILPKFCDFYWNLFLRVIVLSLGEYDQKFPYQIFNEYLGPI